MELGVELPVRQGQIGIADPMWLEMVEHASIDELDLETGRPLAREERVDLGIERHFDTLHQGTDGGIAPTLRRVGIEPNAAMDQCARDKERQAELGSGRRAVEIIARHVDRRRIAADIDRDDVSGGKLMLSLQCQRAIDGCKGMAATAVVLHGNALDVVGTAEIGSCGCPVRAVAHRLAHAARRIENGRRPQQSMLGRKRCQHACISGVSGMQWLRLRIAPEGLLQARSEGRDSGERMAVLPTIESNKETGRRRCAERSNGAGVVPLSVLYLSIAFANPA